MAKRSYGQACALARAGDIIGERWTLLLVRDLLVAPRRFNELQQSLNGIGTNLLATRLRDLEAAGLLERIATDSGPHAYALTSRGRALEPAILALIRWGLVHGPDSSRDAYHQDDWDLLALKALFQADRSKASPLRVQFRNARFLGWMTMVDGSISIGLGTLDNADLVIAGTVKQLFVESRTPEALLTQGTSEQLKQFMGAFALRA